MFRLDQWIFEAMLDAALEELTNHDKYKATPGIYYRASSLCRIRRASSRGAL
jgi:hypothetical protein